MAACHRRQASRKREGHGSALVRGSPGVRPSPSSFRAAIRLAEQWTRYLPGLELPYAILQRLLDDLHQV